MATGKTKKKKEMAEEKVEQVRIVRRKVVEGREELVEEVVEYTTAAEKAPKEAPLPGAKFVSLKEKLKREVLARRLEGRRRRVEERGIDEHEGLDGLPDEEAEGLYDEDEEYLADEEEEDDDEEEGESEPEENDVPMKERKRRRGEFEDDEAEDEDEEGAEEAEDGETDTESVALEDEAPRRRRFRRLVEAPELREEESCGSLAEVRGGMATPTVQDTTAPSTAPSR